MSLPGKKFYVVARNLHEFNCQMVGSGIDSILKTSPIFAALLITYYAT
jgi:hypothetical protein